MYKIMAYK